MKKRFTGEQIIGFLREADAGLPVKELCRKHGFSEPSYYAWKAKFGGMNVSDAQRLKTLEAENNKLKKLLPSSSDCWATGPVCRKGFCQFSRLFAQPLEDRAIHHAVLALVDGHDHHDEHVVLDAVDQAVALLPELDFVVSLKLAMQRAAGNMRIVQALA